MVAANIETLTIYSDCGPANKQLSTTQLEKRLKLALLGKCFDYPARTRSKLLKSAVCEALGYPIPASFQRSHPRFVGQNFDLYAQQSDNLQIWNSELVPGRRYVIVLLSASAHVFDVKVLTGEQLSGIANSQTRTTKLQARLKRGTPVGVLSADSKNMLAVIKRQLPVDGAKHPPLPIHEIGKRLAKLNGRTLGYLGQTQERLRGAVMQQAIHELLDIPTYSDKGQFPDIPSQALEVKLQTKDTIDLGSVNPSGEHRLSLSPDGIDLCPRDMRYAVIKAERSPDKRSYLIESVRLVAGLEFFSFFPQTRGRVENEKIQIHLPKAWFNKGRST